MSNVSGTIVTLGGGGFSFLGRVTAIDDHILGLTGKERPRVCFVPTASGDDDGYAARFERAFAGRARTSVLSLFTKARNETWTCDPRHVLTQDVIYVGGGSTANLLAIWRLHGLPDLLREAAANGTILAGISAGMNCWYEASSTDSSGPLAPLDDGLGFLPGSACPHLFGEEGRAEKFAAWVADGRLPEGHAADDYAALVWRDGTLVDAIAERPGHHAVRVSRSESVDIPTRLLGDELVLTISELLADDDAMGLREQGAPIDEYDSEAGMLADVIRTQGRLTADDVATHLRRIFVEMFDAETAPSHERFTAVAAHIADVAHAQP